VNVRRIMSGQPVWVTPETDVVTAAARMTEYELGALPVCERGRVVGIITDRDIAFRYLGGWSHQGRLVGHYMTRDPVTIGPEESLGRAEELMSRHHVRRLPVCEQGRLIGMITQGDLARHTARSGAKQLAKA
jgi:CBS domain-containing protein